MRKINTLEIISRLYNHYTGFELEYAASSGEDIINGELKVVGRDILVSNYEYIKKKNGYMLSLTSYISDHNLNKVEIVETEIVSGIYLAIRNLYNKRYNYHIGVIRTPRDYPVIGTTGRFNDDLLNDSNLDEIIEECKEFLSELWKDGIGRYNIPIEKCKETLSLMGI